ADARHVGAVVPNCVVNGRRGLSAVDDLKPAYPANSQPESTGQRRRLDGAGGRRDPVVGGEEVLGLAADRLLDPAVGSFPGLQEGPDVELKEPRAKLVVKLEKDRAGDNGEKRTVTLTVFGQGDARQQARPRLLEVELDRVRPPSRGTVSKELLNVPD